MSENIEEQDSGKKSGVKKTLPDSDLVHRTQDEKGVTETAPIVNDSNCALAKELFAKVVIKEFETFEEGTGPAKIAEVETRINRAAKMTRRLVKGFKDHLSDL